jgi:osomolarity two-component system, response regulator SKN7
MHLKVMQQMSVIPRSVGVPPLSDANFEQVLMTNATMMIQQQQQQQYTTSDTTTSNALSSFLPRSDQAQSQFNFPSLLGEDDGGRMISSNPLAGMGLSDEQYRIILQNLVNGESFRGMGMGMDGGGGTGNGSGGGMKRRVDDVGFGGDEREGKRSRFEVIE